MAARSASILSTQLPIESRLTLSLVDQILFLKVNICVPSWESSVPFLPAPTYRGAMENQEKYSLGKSIDSPSYRFMRTTWFLDTATAASSRYPTVAYTWSVFLVAVQRFICRWAEINRATGKTNDPSLFISILLTFNDLSCNNSVNPVPKDTHAGKMMFPSVKE